MSYSVLNTKKIIDVVKYRWIWFALSFVLLFPGILAMGWSMKVYPNHSPLLVGIDFTGGRIIQYGVNQDVSTDKVGEIRAKLTENGIENPVIQVLKMNGDNTEVKNIISIKTQFKGASQADNKSKSTEETEEANGGITADSDDNAIMDKVTEIVSADYPEAQIVQVDSVGPLLGKQLFVNSMIAVSLALLGIVIYLTLRFHFEFAVAAFLALFHDILFVVGVFSILGLFCGVYVDSLFVTAILTVLGFSVHDTIVVFDRIRENVKFYSKNATYGELVNVSVNQTLARSINTSLTTLITLGALYFFGGVTTRDFVLVMILGIAIGTYSSIFFASTLVALWNEVQQSKKTQQTQQQA